MPAPSPPPPPRHRSSSLLRIHQFLGRRRSSFVQNTPNSPSVSAPPSSPQPPPALQNTQVPASPPKQSDNMIVLIASRLLQWLHFHPQHTFSWSAPSTPRSSTEDLVLPLSSSPTKPTFPNVTDEKPSQVVHHFPSVQAPIVIVICLLPISTAFVLYCLSTLPISLSWPRTITDVAQLGRELTGYTQSGVWPLLHVMGVMAISAIWKHAWSVPGAVVWNVLAGALFSPALATIYLTALTTIGSACATLLSMPLAPFLTYLFPKALEMTKSALGGDSDLDQGPPSTHKTKAKAAAWVRLSVLRLIGVVPWSGINIACGVCGVGLGDCMLGSFIGCLPWTAVTCQIGDIIQTVASTPSPSPESISSILSSPHIIFKLVFLSFLSLAPILGRDRLRHMISPSVESQRTPVVVDQGSTRWKWVQDWRAKLRIKALYRLPDTQTELNVLIQEKRALERLPS